jgi:hypothetical protein
MAIKQYASDKFTGLSSDTKPVTVPDGAIFYETDTYKEFIKVGGSWTILTGMIGPTGPQGTQGATGAQGVTGSQGNQGFQGFLGVTGPQGVTGAVGPTGPQGDQGSVGNQGPQGPQGNQGFQGVVGSTGSQGSPGEAAGVVFYLHSLDSSNISGYYTADRAPAEDSEDIKNTSVVDTDGDKLIEEFATETGDPGIEAVPVGTWTFGIYGYVSSSAGTTKLKVEVYKRATGGTETLLFASESPEIDNTSVQLISWEYSQSASYSLLTSDRLVYKVLCNTTETSPLSVYTYYEGSAHVSKVRSTISAGAMGAQGPQGFQGFQGVEGSQGYQGSQGTTGAQGSVGATGPQGVTGAVGPTGPQGNQGDQGSQGVTGAVGPTGPQGVTGSQGNQGFQGTTGSQGNQGYQGYLGSTGPTGPEAAAGATGQIQFNTSNLLDASSDLVWDNSSKRLGIGGTPSVGLDIAANAMEIASMTAPASPAGDNVRVFVTASGTTPNRVVSYIVKFEDGTEVVIASRVV